MATLVATTDPTTGTIRVDVEQTIVRDLFTRVVANGWGNATTGQAWTTGGGVAADYSVNGTQGLHSVNAVNSTRRTTVPLGTVDQDITIFVTIAVTASGAPIEPAIMARFTDANNYYYADISIAPSGVVSVGLHKRVLSVNSNIGSPVVIGGLHGAGNTYGIRFSVCGTTLKAKAWRTNVSEPDWMVTATDFDLTTGSNAGVRSFLAVGNTNALPVIFTYDNFAMSIGQPLHLYRVTTDLVRSEVRGSPFSTEPATAAADTAVATLWDGEAPFDTDVFYELTSDCAATTLVTSNTVNLSSGGDGWLRDPVDPTLNINLDMSGLFDYCVETDSIVFAGLGTRGFANASGHFDIIDAQRVNTVSQLRKRYSSNLVLVTKTLEDGDLIEAIIASGRTLLLSLPLVYGFGRPFGSDYIAIFDVSSDTVGVDQRLEARVWDLPFRLGDPTADTSENGTGGNGIGGGDATYDALAASALGVTYANLAASGETYLQVAQGVGY